MSFRTYSDSFNIHVWRRYYDEAHAIGEIVKKNVRDYYKDGICGLSLEEINELIDKADDVIKQSTIYMNKHGVMSSTSKWHYSYKDTRTHLSSSDFIYGDLL